MLKSTGQSMLNLTRLNLKGDEVSGANHMKIISLHRLYQAAASVETL